MAFSGHGVGLEGSEKSQPARPETTSSDHHEAVVPEQVSATARMSTSKEEKLLKSPAKEGHFSSCPACLPELESL